MENKVTDSNFDEVVLKSSIPVVIDFWAEWCGPCKLIAPIIEQLAIDFEGRALITKVDVDSNPEITTKMNIRNIPTVLFIKDGKVADKIVGATSKNSILAKVEALFK